jgi:hypothetical protein
LEIFSGSFFITLLYLLKLTHVFLFHYHGLCFQAYWQGWFGPFALIITIITITITIITITTTTTTTTIIVIVAVVIVVLKR